MSFNFAIQSILSIHDKRPQHVSFLVRTEFNQCGSGFKLWTAFCAATPRARRSYAKGKWTCLSAASRFCWFCLAASTGSAWAGMRSSIASLPEYTQVLAAMIKVPALFLLTLFVTLPSLYVFNVLAGSRLSGLALLRLLVASLGVTLAVLASFGPIVAFFSVTTTSYPFMLLLNVLLFAVAGVLGLGFLLQTMHRLMLADRQVPPPIPSASSNAGPAESPGALERLPGLPPGRNVRAVFTCWVIVFALVGGK